MSRPKKQSGGRDSHELKREQRAGWRGSYAGSSPAEPQLRVGNGDREPLDSADMRPTVSLTGRYVHTGHGYHLMINQAGPHLEVLLALVESGWSKKITGQPRDQHRSDSRLFRFGGEFHDDADERLTYKVYLHNPKGPVENDELGCGQLVFHQVERSDGPPHLFATWSLVFDTIAYVNEHIPKLKWLEREMARRFDEQPNLFPEHIGHAGVDADVRTLYWFPLTKRQAKRLPGFILGARVGVASEYGLVKEGGQQVGYVDLIRAYYKVLSDGLVSADERRLAKNIVTAMDRAVSEAFSSALELPWEEGGIDQFHQVEWQYASLRTLLDTKIGVTLLQGVYSLYTLTMNILDASHPGATTKNFGRLLGLAPVKGGSYYCADLDLLSLASGEGEYERRKKLGEMLEKIAKKSGKKIGKKIIRQIPVGGLSGTLVVRKQEDPDDVPEGIKPKVDWESTYFVRLAGLTISKGFVTGESRIGRVKTSGEAKHVYGQPWLPAQLEGPAKLLDLSASWYAGAAEGNNPGLTVLTCVPDEDVEPNFPLHLNFSGVAKVMKEALGAEIGFSRLGGDLTYLTADFDVDSMPTPENVDFGAKLRRKMNPLHFPINGACLSIEGERLLATFAACELALLCRDGVDLVVEGYADQPGDEFRNDVLSRNRAVTAFRYIKNILGDALPIHDFEDPPPEADERAEHERTDSSYEIHIPASKRLKIVAHGEPKPGDDGKSKNYRQDQRRVELSISGHVSVSLSRSPEDGG